MENSNEKQSIVFNKEAKEYVPKTKKKNEDPENSKLLKVQSIEKKEIEKVEPVKLNLEAKEFVPKNYMGYTIEADEEEVNEVDKRVKELKLLDGRDVVEDDASSEEEIDKVYDDIIDQEVQEPDHLGLDDESDEDKWFPKFKDCTCCNGYVFKCSGDVCSSLGACFCKAQEDYDPEV